MKKLVLIDGNSILYRAYYATPYFSTSKGVATNAVYGFVNMLLKIITDIKPDHMLVAFDRKEPTYRHKLFEGYKGTRKPMPEDLVPQLPLIKELLSALGIKTFERAGLEADDIIGSAAKTFKIDTIIITGDKDSFQLVDDTTSVYFTKRGISEYEIYNSENFYEKMGINPLQVIDLKACMGDKSDNIPGIPGIGEKTALSLICDYQTIENLYEHTDELKGKLKEKVELGKSDAFLSKTLATIDINADLELKIDDLQFKFPFSQTARKAFIDLEFASILKKDIFEKGDEGSVIVEIEKEQKNKVESVIIEQIMCDKNYFNHEFVSLVIDESISFYNGEKEFKIQIKDNFFAPGFLFDDALQFIKSLFESSFKSKLIVYDKKKLMGMLASFGIELESKVDDVLLQKYVVDYTPKELPLNDLIERAGYFTDLPAYSLYLIYQDYNKLLNEQQSLNVYKEIELPLCDVLFDMEQTGFKVDVNSLNDASSVYKERIEELLQKIKEFAGIDFNPNSPKQLGEVLFERLGLKHGRKNKNGYSTDAEVLEDLEDAHPIIPLILKYRQLSKVLSTYIEGFKPLIDRNSGLIHTVFNQTVTSTGRLSSKEPNLQNIPVRDGESKEIRKFFIPSNEDRVLITADYSQIELRLLAHYSGCKPLIDAFNNGEDIHALTASQVFGVPLNQVTDEQRRSAKAVNFGIIYGISDFGLAKNIKVSKKTAGEYIAKYFEMYPEISTYMKSNVEFAKENGYVCTGFGRRRVINEIKSPNYVVRSFGERAAMNMPLQGTAADIIKIAMLGVHSELKKKVPTAKLILQVHDELIVDANENDKEQVIQILKEQMQGAVNFSVPLTVNVASGKNWYEAK
ncbi:MAG: DNA polymerase I [Clostridia bacterium]|nr:DNA polymerase I [Clostridia bacterium]